MDNVTSAVRSLINGYNEGLGGAERLLSLFEVATWWQKAADPAEFADIKTAKLEDDKLPEIVLIALEETRRSGFTDGTSSGR